ncbi:hypothetical protein A9G33_02125 [Gilliamella sp. Choc3-5]|uniref:Uncharacterized protein n=1 Tax=Candidatus Schmidhempelia bombi str. Bimp TaxID=1387197 RepID=A0AB94IAA5_9GAMM|nr:MULTISPECIES: putative holin [Orbaceae]OCG32934.1 hypothetical protein A9G33_02125 [Gilliamella apicola]TEA26312.1 hypothetical protein O970_09345 [Candidatus Schmidhempelia bombi str. Bimp]
MKLFKKVRERRLLTWLISAVILFVVIAVLAPQQLPIVIYKLSLVLLAAVIGYHLDRALFPYASPGSYLSPSKQRQQYRRLSSHPIPKRINA